MFKKLLVIAMLFISVSANAVIINIDGGTYTALSNYEESGVLIEDLGIANTVLPPIQNEDGIFLYDSGLKISMVDNSLFDLLSLGWTDWNTTLLNSGVIYEDSNGETLTSVYSDGLILSESFFGSFGQGVEWISLTSYPEGHKVLDFLEVEASVVTVPEPSVLALLSLGLLGMLSFRKTKAV